MMVNVCYWKSFKKYDQKGLAGSLWMPIGFHIAWNYFQGSIFGFPVSGTAPKGIYNIGEVGGTLWTGDDFGPEGGLLATLL